VVNISFSAFEPLQQLCVPSRAESHDTSKDIFLNAISGVLLRTTPKALPQNLRELDDGLLERLSLAWLPPTTVCRKTLAIIEGGFNYDFRQRVLEDAFALGIEVIAIG
jgi:hypothetical protein